LTVHYELRAALVGILLVTVRDIYTTHGAVVIQLLWRLQVDSFPCLVSSPLYSAILIVISKKNLEFDGPPVCALRRAIAEVKQRWSVTGWVTKN
jgi:hypothetical protein